MRKGDVVTIEGSGEEIKLLHPIGKGDKTGRFWEVEFADGTKDIRLLIERVTVADKEKVET